MRQSTARIVSHTLEPLGRPALNLDFSEELPLGPGQFFLAALPGAIAALRTRLFPIDLSPRGMISDRIPSPAWLPGQSVDLLGPLGKPFSPPEGARRWLLISLGQHPERLLPLIQLGAGRSASIAFWSAQPLPTLAADVERSVEPEEALDWAEYIALELPGLSWPEAQHGLRSRLGAHTAPVQALVDIPTPCGLGACQACALPAGRTWDLGCQSGLVLPMEKVLA